MRDKPPNRDLKMAVGLVRNGQRNASGGCRKTQSQRVMWNSQPVGVHSIVQRPKLCKQSQIRFRLPAESSIRDPPRSSRNGCAEAVPNTLPYNTVDGSSERCRRKRKRSTPAAPPAVQKP